MPTTRKKLSGMDGAVLISGTAYCIKSWKLTVTTEDINVTDTCSDEGWAEFIATFKTGTGSLSSFFDQNAPPDLDLVGTVVPVQLITNNAVGSGVGYKCDILVTSYDITSDVAGAVTADLSFKVTNAVTRFTVSI